MSFLFVVAIAAIMAGLHLIGGLRDGEFRSQRLSWPPIQRDQQPKVYWGIAAVDFLILAVFVKMFML